MRNKSNSRFVTMPVSDLCCPFYMTVCVRVCVYAHTYIHINVCMTYNSINGSGLFVAEPTKRKMSAAAAADMNMMKRHKVVTQCQRSHTYHLQRHQTVAICSQLGFCFFSIIICFDLANKDIATLAMRSIKPN